MDVPGWSNGRDVVTFAKRTFVQFSKRAAAQRGAGSSGTGPPDECDDVSSSDLQLACTDFLKSKTPMAKKGPRSGGSAPSPTPQIAFASQTASAQPPPSLAPSIEALVKAREAAEEAQAPDEAPLPARAFAGLDSAWLAELQSTLEELGYDLTSEDALGKLASDGGVLDVLAEKMKGKAGVTDSDIISKNLRSWQEELKQQWQQEQEAKKKKLTPIWRCAVCGRYGCPVAPYIESYREVE